MKKIIISYILEAVLVLSLVLGLMFFVFCAIMGLVQQEQEEINVYNNGICSTCNNSWKFTNGETEKGTEFYYYSCDKCHKIIRIHSYIVS